jgi:putative transcriptional regulator
MPIIVNLDVVLAQRKMRLNDLAEAVGITPQNLSILKTGKARAIRFSTLEAICNHLNCQPGDILEFRPEAGSNPPNATAVAAEPPPEARPPSAAAAGF